jgi:hypothetical protein
MADIQPILVLIGDLYFCESTPRLERGDLSFRGDNIGAWQQSREFQPVGNAAVERTLKLCDARVRSRFTGLNSTVSNSS